MLDALIVLLALAAVMLVMAYHLDRTTHQHEALPIAPRVARPVRRKAYPVKRHERPQMLTPKNRATPAPDNGIASPSRQVRRRRAFLYYWRQYMWPRATRPRKIRRESAWLRARVAARGIAL